jgi:hypothetical protein
VLLQRALLAGQSSSNTVSIVQVAVVVHLFYIRRPKNHHETLKPCLHLCTMLSQVNSALLCIPCLLLHQLHLAVLVAWRSRRTTAIRVLAPFLFLLLALVVNLALNANNALQERFVATPAAVPFSIGGIPSCHEDLHIGPSKPCIDFVYSPNNDTVINVSSRAGACSRRSSF